MKFDAVDFHAPVFVHHPEGWQSPADLAEGFLLAWALEVQARRHIDPYNPFANHVRGILPKMFSHDTFGELVRVPGRSSHWISAGEIPRLTTLCIVWKLFDELNANWQLTSGDITQYAHVLAFATGGRERESLFRELSADLAKCLLSDRISRALRGSEDLTAAEEWFVTGESQLLNQDSSGYEVVPFYIGGSYIPITILDNSFVNSVWSAVRVLVEMSTPEAIIARYGHRSDVILDILARGAVLFWTQKTLPPAQAWGFKTWPGWTAGD